MHSPCLSWDGCCNSSVMPSKASPPSFSATGDSSSSASAGGGPRFTAKPDLPQGSTTTNLHPNPHRRTNPPCCQRLQRSQRSHCACQEHRDEPSLHHLARH